MEKKFDLNGIWHNQYGSEMKLECDSSGRVTGKFRTAVGRAETQKEWQDKWFDLVGFVNRDTISFVVNFGSATGATNAVAGKIIPSLNRIETVSLVNYDLPESERWKSLVVGTVNYERGPAVKS